MNGRDLLEGLSHVDPALIEAAEAVRPRRRPRPWLLAACICLALAGTACAVGTLWSVQIGQLSTGAEESSYSVYGTVRTVPEEDFSQAVHDALEANWSAWQAKSPQEQRISSALPGVISRGFETWAEGADYLGIPLVNPLEDAGWLEQASTVGMPLDGDYGRVTAYHCKGLVQSDPDGRVEAAHLEAGYRAGEIRVMLRTELRTEYAGETAADGSQGIETGSVWPEAVNLYQNAVTMPDGQAAALVVSQPWREDSYVSIDAYFIQDGLLYRLDVVGPDGGSEAVAAVREVLEQALDCFA